MTTTKILTPLAAAIRFPIEDNFSGERFPVDATITVNKKTNKIRFSRPIHQLSVHGSDWQRPRCPLTGRLMFVNGDVARIKGELRLLWNSVWHGIPSVDCLMEWTLDSVCPTPDGDEVEPDAPDSWLSILGLV